MYTLASFSRQLTSLFLQASAWPESMPSGHTFGLGSDYETEAKLVAVVGCLLILVLFFRNMGKVQAEISAPPKPTTWRFRDKKLPPISRKCRYCGDKARYITGPCCDDPSCMERGREDYDKETANILKQIK